MSCLGVYMKRTSLRKLLTKALRAAQATTVLTAATCGDSGTHVDLSLYARPSCTATGYPSLDGLNPSTPVDYLELRDIPASTSGGTPTTLSQSGVPCWNAPDPAACKATLGKVTPTTTFGINGGCFPFCYPRVLLTTKDGTVRVIETKAALDAFLAPYDTAQEAVLAAMAAGRPPNCTDPETGAVRAVDGGFEVVVPAGSPCGTYGVYQAVLFIDASGSVTERTRYKLRDSDPNCVVGRRPAGLLQTAKTVTRGASCLGIHFAHSARLEAASVIAFRVLRAELTQHGASRKLLRKASESARDEIRHTRMTRRLARRFHTSSERPSICTQPSRTLLEIAIENAVEGCVRETYGALVGMWQAAHARDRVIARSMSRIARDETRHAALSQEVAAWLWPRLSEQEKSLVNCAARDAIVELRQALLVSPEPELVTHAGLPNTAQALALHTQLEQTLWHRFPGCVQKFDETATP